MRQLTLLSGTNASGKSSVLQALCVLHQTMRDFEWSPRLMLNGSVVTLGTVMDLVDQVHGHGNVHGSERWILTTEKRRKISF
ncbi:MAG: hypothetical protein OXF06_10790 [Bacteroidetes bacterium]|nr:hypothetical protein [Bacteroidota bacterium]